MNNTTDTAAELANVATWRQVAAELELTIDDATQWATIYRDGRPIATAQRRRVLDRTSPDWQIFGLDGRRIFALYFGGQDPAARIRKRLAAYLVDQAPAPAPAKLDEIQELEARRRQLLADRLMTNGHGRRARIQEQIDAIDAKLELLAEQAGA
jgi:hypothetical protein